AEHDLHDLLFRQSVIQREPESFVVEGRLANIEPEQHECSGLNRHEFDVRLAGEPVAFDDGQSITDHVDVSRFHAANHLLDAGRLDIVNAVQLRAAGPVIAVGDDVAIDVLFKLDELEGAAGNHPAVSGRIPIERRRHADLFRHAFPHMLRQDHDLRQAYGGERRGRGLQLYPQAAVAGLFGAGDAIHERLPQRRLPLQQVIEGELRVVDRDRLAVVPLHVGPQRYVVGERIDLIDFLGGPGNELKIAVIAKERVEHEAEIATAIGRTLGEWMRRAHPERGGDVDLAYRRDRLDLKVWCDVIALEPEAFRQMIITKQRGIDRINLVARADRP